MLDSTSSSEETAPFLKDEGPEHYDKESGPATSLSVRSYASRETLYRTLIVVHFILIVVNGAWTFYNLKQSHSPRTRPNQPIARLYEATGAPMSIKNESWTVPIGKRSPFTDLDPAVADAAWADVNMGGRQGWLKVPRAEVDLLGLDSIQFSDHSGYLFGLDVFHQLHCLDFLRKKTVLYSPLYPVVEEDEDIPVAYHIAHCIDSIRLSLQCHADLTLIPQRWAEGWSEPWAIWTGQHQCRDFDTIVEWARESYPDFSDKLVHPELGVFHSGKLNHSALPIWQEPHDELPDFL